MTSIGPFKRDVLPGSGDYGVGCTDFMSNTSETEVGCFFCLFYPVNKSDKEDPFTTPWLPSPEYAKGYGSVVDAPGIGFFTKIFAGSKKIPAHWNAPLVTADKTLPVVIFSHGLSSCRTTYSSICTDLASHGFVVAAVEHRDESACLSYYLKKNGPNGNVVKDFVRYKRAPYDEFDLRNKQVKQRAAECIAALDTLTALHAGKEVENLIPDKFDLMQLKDRLDLDRVAVCGHSFGGGTSVVAMSEDTRFKCSVPLDAWLFPLSEDVYDKIQQQPILFINTYSFQWRENIERINRLMPAEYTAARRMITIRDTVHFSQCDIPMLLHLGISRRVKYRGELRPDVALRINNRAMIAFLWKHLDITPSHDWTTYATGEEEHLLVGTNVKLEASM